MQQAAGNHAATFQNEFGLGAKKYGAEFKAPKLLVDMAAKGETFYQRFDPYAKAQAKEAA